MYVNHTERTNVRRFTPPPVELDDGRLDVPRAVLSGLFVLGGLVVATLGAWIITLATNGYTWNWIGLAFGVGVVVVSAGFSSIVGYVQVSEWLQRRQRITEWHTASLAAYEDLGAVESVDQITEWALSTDNPGHVVLAALSVYARHREGALTPWSVRSLRGPLFLAGRRVGELSKTGAEEMSREFARLGLVAGRVEGYAGEWTANNADDVLQHVISNWKKSPALEDA